MFSNDTLQQKRNNLKPVLSAGDTSVVMVLSSSVLMCLCVLRLSVR